MKKDRQYLYPQKCKIFYFWPLNRQIYIMITPIKDACQKTIGHELTDRKYFHPERIWKRYTLTLGL